MARPLRPEHPGTVWHAYNRGVNRADIFFSDEDRVLFIALLAESVRRFRWKRPSVHSDDQSFSSRARDPGAHTLARNEMARRKVCRSGTGERSGSGSHARDSGTTRQLSRARHLVSAKQVIGCRRAVRRAAARDPLPIHQCTRTGRLRSRSSSPSAPRSAAEIMPSAFASHPQLPAKEPSWA
jgi:hypothetical protein